MKDPTKGFCQVVAGVDDARTMTQDDVDLVSPFLNGEVLNLDVLCTGSRPILIDHGNCSLVMNEKGRCTRCNKRWSGKDCVF